MRQLMGDVLGCMRMASLSERRWFENRAGLFGLLRPIRLLKILKLNGSSLSQE